MKSRQGDRHHNAGQQGGVEGLKVTSVTEVCSQRDPLCLLRSYTTTTTTTTTTTSTSTSTTTTSTVQRVSAA
ncbi:hypothetical protein EYF80_038667 [Liparis tanakae]|uniref:Uncharacterized protein n=1 Tax=Liparis tanakae TaxID=230148 RepID=A0A4Z2GC42_9TELE|nr:hypothetical protein EYF80_038667 [Liparis tanakae]